MAVKSDGIRRAGSPRSRRACQCDTHDTKEEKSNKLVFVFDFFLKSGSERTQFTILMLHPDAGLLLTNFLVAEHNRIQCVSFYSLPFTVASSSSTIRCDSIFIWDPQRCQSLGALASNTNAQLLLGICCFSRVFDAAMCFAEENEGEQSTESRVTQQKRENLRLNNLSMGEWYGGKNRGEEERDRVMVGVEAKSKSEKQAG